MLTIIHDEFFGVLIATIITLLGAVIGFVYYVRKGSH
jgi:hypothetical protein